MGNHKANCWGWCIQAVSGEIEDGLLLSLGIPTRDPGYSKLQFIWSLGYASMASRATALCFHS